MNKLFLVFEKGAILVRDVVTNPVCETDDVIDFILDVIASRTSSVEITDIKKWADFLCDGEALESQGINDVDTVESIYNLLIKTQNTN